MGIIIVLAALVVGVFSIIKYARKAYPANTEGMTWLTTKLIAHRGIHDKKSNIPENSLQAFALAIEKGYPIELDISLTKDSKLVIIHDKKLKRLFGLNTYLSDATYEELSKLKIQNSNETVPLFSEVLTFVAGRVPLLIEIKNEGKVGLMESMVYEDLKEYQGKYAIQSFNPYTVKWFRINAPNVFRGQLAGSNIVSDYEVEYQGTSQLHWYKSILLKNLLLNFESKPNFIAYEVKYTSNDYAKNLRKLGVPIIGWSIQDQAEYDKVKAAYDNFIVDETNLK